MRLIRHHDELWTAEMPFRFLGVLSMGARCAVVRLANGTLLVYSPLRLSDALRDEIAAIGAVRHLVAPNRFHHLFVQEWQEAFPEAETWAAPGLPEKRREIQFDHELGAETPAGWRPTLESEWIRGADALSEVVLHHPASASLICCDLLFNVLQTRSRLTNLYLRFAGIYGRAGVSRVVRLAFRDRKAAARSLERVWSWEFERVVLAHGQIIECGGSGILRDRYAWLLEA